MFEFRIVDAVETVTVDNPITLNPSIFLYAVDDIPAISTISLLVRLCGIVATPVTTPSKTENSIFSITVFVVATDTISLPETSLISAFTVKSLKLSLSPTLYEDPASFMVISVIFELFKSLTLILVCEFKGSDNKG